MIIGSFGESKFYRTIVQAMNDRVGRYALFVLIFSAGMWNAATGKSVVFDMNFPPDPHHASLSDFVFCDVCHPARIFVRLPITP